MFSRGQQPFPWRQRGWCGKECFNGDRRTQARGAGSEGTNCEQDWCVTARSGHKTRWKQDESVITLSAASQVVSRETESVLCASTTPECQRSAAPVLCPPEEPELKKASTRDNCIKCGTNVSTGKARLMVVATFSPRHQG